MVLYPNSLFVFGNLFLESSLTFIHVYMLTVSTRDLVDHTCLFVLKHSVLYPHQSLADHMNRFEDGLDPLRLEGPTSHFSLFRDESPAFTYGSTGSFPCQGPVQLIVNAFGGVLWQNFYK